MKGVKIILHAKLPTFGAVQIKGFYSTRQSEICLMSNSLNYSDTLRRSYPPRLPMILLVVDEGGGGGRRGGGRRRGRGGGGGG